MNRLIIPPAASPRILVVTRRVVRNLVVSALLMTTAAASAHAAPPPDASGVFADWFKSLTVPGIPGAPCCTLADCRMVDATWNDQTQHYEARGMREKVSNAPG